MAEIGWAMFPLALKDDNTSHSEYFLSEAATQSSHRANWGSKLNDWDSKTEKWKVLPDLGRLVPKGQGAFTSLPFCLNG